MTDGGLTVFEAGGRAFCWMEVIREACGQFHLGRCTMDEFMDMYEAAGMAAVRNLGRGDGEGCLAG